MGYWAKDHSYVRDASDDAPRRTQGDAWEAEQRVIKGMKDWETQEKRRKEGEKELRIANYEAEQRKLNERIAASRYEQDQIKAINIIIEQKRQEYNKKSLLGKAIAKLRGKTFAKMRNEIEDYATRSVENMSPGALERFIEKNSEQKGRAR